MEYAEDEVEDADERRLVTDLDALSWSMDMSGAEKVGVQGEGGMGPIGSWRLNLEVADVAEAMEALLSVLPRTAACCSSRSSSRRRLCSFWSSSGRFIVQSVKLLHFLALFSASDSFFLADASIQRVDFGFLSKGRERVQSSLTGTEEGAFGAGPDSMRRVVATERVLKFELVRTLG